MAAPSMLTLDDTFSRALPDLVLDWQPAAVPTPTLVAFDDTLAASLGLDAAALRAPDGVALLAGNIVPDDAHPVAMAYAGHQFGGYSPRLGDGRALLLGEVTDAQGRRWDLHLKGSGRTPFARGGDGKATIGPMLREYVIAQFMHAVGIPTTRALAVVSTGEHVQRAHRMEPGAVLTRVAASHIRVGTFQYAAHLEDRSVLAALTDHAIARHHPTAADAPVPALALLDGVVRVQAELIAHWMLLGFIHGVMNTDNMTISGEGIDYGPCAFMDRFDPSTVFSSIDHGGRYAYGNQPAIAQWNLTRLAESLLSLIADDRDAAVEAATASLNGFAPVYERAFVDGMARKLGFGDRDPGDPGLFDDLLTMLHVQHVDFTSAFRWLARSLRDDPVALTSFPAHAEAEAWADRWRSRLATAGVDDLAAAADAMDRVNPVYIPRNHILDDALEAATNGELSVVEQLLEILAEPFTERDGLARFAEPAPPGFDEGFQTFCGT